jgi:hypothetical protein
MQPSPPCPVCGGNRWQTLGKRTWRLGESNDPIIQKRLRVLFEVWFPGSQEFTASSELCRDCGSVIYAPRPTAEDLNAKYRFLTTLGPDKRFRRLKVNTTRFGGGPCSRSFPSHSRSRPLIASSTSEAETVAC